MDFGGFFLFGFLVLGLLVGAVIVVAWFVTHSRWRWRGFGVWLGGLLLLAALGRFLYQVYWLDEQLFFAASSGNTARVEALLSAGASPDAAWVGGTALSAARSAGHKDVVKVLERAGAVGRWD